MILHKNTSYTTTLSGDLSVRCETISVRNTAPPIISHSRFTNDTYPSPKRLIANGKLGSHSRSYNKYKTANLLPNLQDTLENKLNRHEQMLVVVRRQVIAGLYDKFNRTVSGWESRASILRDKFAAIYKFQRNEILNFHLFCL